MAPALCEKAVLQPILYQRLSLRGNKILYSLAVVGTPAPAERMCVNLSNLGRSPSAPDGN